MMGEQLGAVRLFAVRSGRHAFLWRFLIVAGVLTLLAAGCGSPTDSPAPGTSTVVSQQPPTNYWRGSANAKVVIEEWVDLQ